MYSSDMSYTKNLVQGWKNLFIYLLIYYTSLYCIVDKRKEIKFSCSVIFIMITKTYNKIREYLQRFTWRIYAQNLFPLTSDPDTTVVTAFIHLTYFPWMSLQYNRKNCKGYCLTSSVTSWWVGMNTIWVSRKSSRKESPVEEGRLSRPPTPPPPPRPSNRVSRRCSSIFCGVPAITVYLKQNARKMLLHSQIILYCTVSTQGINMIFIDQLIILNVFRKACKMLVSKKFHHLPPNLKMNERRSF